MKHAPYTANLSTEAKSPGAWQDRAKCRVLPADILEKLFWPEGQGKSLKDAKAFCRGTDGTAPCPVRAECLAYALALPTAQTDVGCWAGYSARELRKIRQGRPVSDQLRGTHKKGDPSVRRPRTLRPASPLRDALNELIGPRFPNPARLSRYVTEHSTLNRGTVERFLYSDRQRVSIEWATIVCTALGMPDLPARLWPEETAA